MDLAGWTTAQAAVMTAVEMGGLTYLHELKREISVLHRQLDSASSRSASNLGHGAENDGQQRHEYGKQNDREEAGDNTLDSSRNVVNEAQEGQDADEVIHLRDGSDKGDRDRPEDHKSDNERGRSDLTDHTLPNETLSTKVRREHLARQQQVRYDRVDLPPANTKV